MDEHPRNRTSSDAGELIRADRRSASSSTGENSAQHRGLARSRNGGRAITLPTGDWKIDANGFRGVLTITGVDGAGNLNARTSFNGEPTNQVIGFWDDTSKKITFIRVIDPNNPSRNQIYTGFYFNNQRDHPTDLSHTLTGYFEAFQGTGAVAQRVLYGWWAGITVVG